MIKQKRHMLVLATLAMGLMLLAGCGNQSAAGVEVKGKLVDLCGQPLAYKTVLIPGHQPVLTNADGEFSVPDVEAPYDVVVANAHMAPLLRADQQFVVYKGLTEEEPLIWAGDVNVSAYDSCAKASANVTVTSSKSGSEYTNGAALILAPYSNARTFSTDSSASFDLYFNPDDAGAGTLFGIQWKTDSDNGDATEFVGVKSAEVQLSDGANIEKELALDEDGISSHAYSLSVVAPDVYGIDEIMSFVTVGDATVGLNTATIGAGEADDDGKYHLVAPVADGVGSMVFVSARYGGRAVYKSLGALDISDTEGYAGIWQKAPSDSDEMTVEFPEPVVSIVPFDGATLDLNDAAFSWTGHEGDVYEALFRLLAEDHDISVEVVTTDTSLQLPDLEGLGLSYDGIGEGMWALLDFGGGLSPQSVDATASVEGFHLLSPIYLYSDDFYPSQKEGYFFYIEAGRFTTPQQQSE